MVDYSIIFVIINSWLVLHICRNDKVHLLLKILLCVSYFGWNALPALLMYIPSLIGMDVKADETYITCSYYNQVYLFFAYLLASCWISRRRSPKFLTKRDFQDDASIFNILFFSSLVLSIYRVIRLINSTTTYWEANDLSNLSALGPLDFISSLGISFLVGCLLLCKDRIKPFFFKFSIGIISLFLLAHTIRGGRIYLFGIIIIVLYYALKSKRKTGVFLGTALVVLALALLPVLASLRGSQRISISDIKLTSESSTSSLIFAEILTKTNSVMYGSYLIDKDGIGKWDGQMYSSTIFALIPRFIYPAKPEPGSVDGTQYGLPARASSMYSTVGEYNDIGNNGVPASLSSIWGGGWLAYIVEILFTAFLIFFINGVFYSSKPIFTGFIFSLLSFPVGILEIPLPTILVALQRDVVIFLVLSLLLSPFANKQSKK